MRDPDLRHPHRTLAPRLTLLLFTVFAVNAQTLAPAPGFLQDLAGQFPLTGGLSLEQQFQVGTQANPATANPFAYGHGLQFRPWLHYDAIPNTTLTASVSYIYYLAVPETSFYRHPEWRDTLMITVKQALKGGSLYEQIRGELLNFRDSHGVAQHLPRMRVRFGQNFYLGEGGSRLNKPYLGLYEETILQFPQPTYSRVTFASARVFAGSGFELGSRTQVLVGFKGEGQVASNGSTVTLFFGPAFSVEYNFRELQPIHENHRRTTAFRSF